MWTRRQFLSRATASAAAGVVGYTFLVEPHWLEIVRRDLPLAGLPPHLAGQTLAHLSDLHIGPQVDDGYLIETFRRVAALRPDFVAVTGDWTSYRDLSQFDQMRRVLAHLPRGPSGTVGIFGNHDYAWGWDTVEVAEAIRGIVTQAGVTLLDNEATVCDGLQFIGLDDYWGPRFNPVPVLAAHGGHPATIVLCHNPDVCDLPVWGKCQSWILAGHTHGGQCKPPFLPPPLLPVRNRRYTCGEFALEGGRRLYISRGVGHLLQVRFNVRPEATLFRLVPA